MRVSETPETPDLTEESLNSAADAAVAAFEQAADLAALEEAHRAHLGEQAFIPQARRALGQLPKDQRKDAGRLVNMARGRVEKAYAQVRQVREAEYRQQRLKDETVDVKVHTYHKALNRIADLLLDRICYISVGRCTSMA